MTAEEIREEVKRNCMRWEVTTADLIPLATYGMVAEIAAQLAELNSELRKRPTVLPNGQIYWPLGPLGGKLESQ